MVKLTAMLIKYKFTIGATVAALIIALAITLAVALPVSDDKDDPTEPPPTDETELPPTDEPEPSPTDEPEEPIDPMGKFIVDYETDTFLLDGVPFQYLSGSFHYFRSTPETWREKLELLKAAGLNAVDIYVYWGLHNPHEDVYNFAGLANVTEFIQIAQELDLYILLRPSPYICAEIDNGGIPHWLYKKYPNIKLRTSDPDYLAEVSKWMSVLMPQFEKFLYGNGGKIIMVQIENEYGIYHACDQNYMEFLRNETLKYVDDSVLLFTTDIPNATVACGTVENVYATIDFGADRALNELEYLWGVMRIITPKGPLVNSEFYTGWLTHWQEENQIRPPQWIADALRAMLQYKANVNFYMIYGGTNFGFTAGANDWGIGEYKADLTSYDYDAPITEAGDPTEKLHLIRDVISEFFPDPTRPELPPIKPKMKLDDVTLAPIELLLSDASRRILGVAPVIDAKPKTFEQLDQFSGFVLYETDIPAAVNIDPTQLIVEGLHDRAQVFVDGIFLGTLSRENVVHSLPIHLAWGTKLQILVENQGRINFNDTTDNKGILGRVTLQLYDGALHELTGWTSTGFPFEDLTKLDELVASAGAKRVDIHKTGVLLDGPVLYYGEFEIDVGTTILDTWLDPRGWSKGVIFINGFNLGRYWPIVGPQVSVYLPKDLLREGTNKLVVLELQKAVPGGVFKFSDVDLWK